jgi:hypothetical protein
MSGALHTYLDGVRMGTLSRARQGSLGFVYNEDYLVLADPTPRRLADQILQHAVTLPRQWS